MLPHWRIYIAESEYKNLNLKLFQREADAICFLFEEFNFGNEQEHAKVLVRVCRVLCDQK